MIHLLGKTYHTYGKPLCGGNIKDGSVGTFERPPNRHYPNLCVDCFDAYWKAIDDAWEANAPIRAAYQAKLDARPIRQKLHDWCMNYDRLFEGTSGYYNTMLIPLTCGLVFIPQFAARLLLKLGV
jgi:hypothetical protein